jgi:predicted ATPase
VVEALRPLFKPSTGSQDENGRAIEALSPTWLGELSRLLPELHEYVPDLPAPSGQESTAATRLFEAVVQVGITLATQHPLVLLIDDVQWADAASLDLLLYACRRWFEENTPVLLLFTLRSEALAQVTTTSNTLRDWLYNLRREGEVTRLPLSPLTEKATHELVEELVAQGDVDAFARWLYRETGGQPFFIMETLEALVEAGMARSVEDTAGRRLDVTGVEQKMNAAQPLLPAGVRQLIRQRLSRLTPEATNLLAAAAVLGQTFHFRQLCRVADREAVSSLAALDELLSARLLEAGERSSRLAEYRFTHDKIRDVVYTEAGDARRHLFHERAFAHLQESGAPPAQLAHHALAAGLAKDAFDCHLAAGDEAMELFAVRDAIDFYRQAQRALSEAQELRVGTQKQRHLYEKLGRAYELENRWEAAADVYEEMLALARARSEPAMTVAALTRLAGTALRGDWRRDRAVSHLQEARAIAEAQNDKAGLVEISITLSQALLYSTEREAAVAHAERALRLARDLGQEELVARSLNALTYARFGPPSALQQVEAEAAEARTLFAGAGNRALEADSLAMVGHVQLHSGRPREALNTLREAQAIVLDIENSWGQVNVAFHLAFALLEVGQVDEALSVIQAGVETGRKWGHDALLAGALNIRGAVYRARGAFDQAQADHETARSRFSDLSFELLSPIIAVHLCADCALAGDRDAALEYARQSLVLEDLTWLWNWFDTGFCYHHVVQTLARAGDTAQAQEALERYQKATGDNPRYRLPYLQARAALAKATDREDEAVDSLQEALDLARALGLPRQKRAVLAALADVEEGRGNEETAAALRRQAQEITHAAQNA